MSLLDSKLKWNKQHIKHLEKKCKKRLHVMHAVAKKALLTRS